MHMISFTSDTRWVGKLRTGNPRPWDTLCQGYAYEGEMLSLQKEGSSETSTTGVNLKDVMLSE